MTLVIIAGLIALWLYNCVHVVDGREIRIVDGDSVRIPLRSLAGARGVMECRLVGIDAPEWDQPQGPIAHRGLARMLDQPRIRVFSWRRDAYGRALVTLYGDGGSINDRMIAEGFAFADGLSGSWAMHRAKRARLGIWKDGPVVPPSEWRVANTRRGAGGTGGRRRRQFDIVRLMDPSLPKFMRGFMPRGRR